MDHATTHANHATTPTTNDHDSPTTRTVTIREAADLCGTTQAAMRGRVERGTVRHVLGRDGKRRIPVSELRRVGLLDHARNHDDPANVAGMAPHHATVAGMADFVAALERLHAENVAVTERAVVAETRLQLEQQTASTIETELHRTRAELAAATERADQLAADLAARGRRRWFRRS